MADRSEGPYLYTEPKAECPCPKCGGRFRRFDIELSNASLPISLPASMGVCLACGYRLAAKLQEGVADQDEMKTIQKHADDAAIQHDKLTTLKEAFPKEYKQVANAAEWLENLPSLILSPENRQQALEYIQKAEDSLAHCLSALDTLKDSIGPEKDS